MQDPMKRKVEDTSLKSGGIQISFYKLNISPLWRRDGFRHFKSIYNLMRDGTLKAFADEKAIVKVGSPKDECAICGKVFINNSRYLRHWSFHKNHHKVRDKLLIQRYRRFLEIAAIVVMKRRYLNKFAICVAKQRRNRKLKSSSSMQTELIVQRCIRLRCYVCNCVYVTASCLRLHMSKHRKFHCLKCENWFYSKRRLQVHSRDHNDSSGVSEWGSARQRAVAIDTTCDTCGKSFSSKSCLNRHLRVHTGVKPYLCHVCGDQFKERALVKKHMVVHTGISLPISHKCHICNKGFTRSSILHHHLKGHGEKTLSCLHCHKKFSHIKLLNRHLLAHGERRFQCSMCSKAFLTKSDLQRHLKTHSGEKPYPCNWCDKRFRQSGNLKVHERIHTNEKPYQCSICQRKFAQAANLKHHMSLHYGKANLHCSQSDEAFENIVLPQDDRMITIHVQPSMCNMTCPDSQLAEPAPLDRSGQRSSEQ